MTSITTEELVAKLRGAVGNPPHVARQFMNEAAARLAELERERDQWKERAGFLWTAPDVDAWGRAAEAKGLPLRDKINGLLRRACRAEESALAAESSLEEAKGVIERAYWIIERDDTISDTGAEEIQTAFRAFFNRSSISNSAAKGTNSLPPREDGVKLEGGEL